MTKLTGFHIESVYAFIAVAEDGDEGVMGLQTINGMLPLVAADKTRLEELRPLVLQAIALEPAPFPVKIVQFTTRVDLETLGEEKS